MRRALALALVSVVLTACGESQQQRVEEIGSLAAEGALLAHDASEPRGSTEVYTRVHADELAGAARSVAEKVSPPVAELARQVARDLDRLAENPNDEALAQRLEHGLKRAADEAERLAKAS
jgi:hypothetical protein